MSLPFRVILAPVDLHESSIHALDLARQLAGDGTLHLLHITEIVPAPGEAAGALAARENEVKSELEKIARDQLTGVSCQTHVRHGDTARAIVEMAREVCADLIVMPTHGRRGLPRFFLGSVAERIVREAPCPVLTVRPSAAAAETRTVADIMIKHPPSVGPTDTLSDAHEIMQRHDVLSLPVLADGVLAGIITDRDLRSHSGELEETRVQTVMAPAPVAVAPSMPVEEAANLLVNLGVGSLPVVENGRLVGLVSNKEIIQSLLDGLKAAKVSWPR